MKKIFFVILVLWSAVSYSQAPNYNNYNVRNHFWQFSTNGLNIPAGATPAKLTGQYARSGALYYDTTGVDTGLYVSHGTYWVQVGGLTGADNGLLKTSGTVGIGGSALTRYSDIQLNGFPLTINHNGVATAAQSDSNSLRLTNNTASVAITDSLVSPGITQLVHSRILFGADQTVRFRTDVVAGGSGGAYYRIKASVAANPYTTIFQIRDNGLIPDNLNLNGHKIGQAGTGSSGLRFGDEALNFANNSSVTGGHNTAIGSQAMRITTSGAQNTAIGSGAMLLNTTGTDNTVIGKSALATNTTANNNTAVGAFALNLNTTGSENTGIGKNALSLNTTAIKNTAIGAGAMEKTTTGGFNTAGGEDVMLNNLTGINNTAFGYLSLATMTAGNGNVSLGYIAGTTFTSGDNNIWIGNQAGTHASQALAPTNSIAIGYNSFTTASNQIVIGNSSHTTAKFFGIPSGVGTKAVRYDPSTNELTYGDTTSGGGSGSGTVNTGAANKATYYPSAGTTVDDFIGVEYGLTNNTMRLLPQAVGDTALVILAKASQTAPLLVAQNSAGLAQFKIWENGYIGNSIYKLYPVEFHTNVGGVYARFGTNFAFATAPENSQVGYGAFGRTDGSEVGLYKYDATGGIGFYVNGITTPKVYLAASNSNLGIGTGTTVSARLHSLSTTEQLRLGYDASNYLSTTIGSTGGTTFDAIGAGSIFNFSDNVTITNNSLNGNQLYVSSTSTAVNGPASLVRADFSGANAAASVSTYGGFFNNSRTGTTSLTYGVYGQASDGTTNYGVFGQASGGTTAIGGNFTVSGASNNYPIITAGGNSGFNTANPTSVLHTTSFATAYRAITALRTLDITDHTIEVTSGTFTVTLPTAVGITGRQYIITNSGAGTTTIATTSSQTFVNVTATPTTLTVNQYGVVTVVSNGANWLRTSSLGFGLFVLIVLLPTLVFRRRNFLDDCYKQAA